jgi:hypothetical protein
MFTKLDIRVKNPKPVNGKKRLVTTVKTTISGNAQETTVKRTINGEHADLQLKFINRPKGKVEYLHIHCQKDKQSSKWGKASGLPIEKFYDIFQDNNSQIIRCKICRRKWSSGGWTANS